MQKKKEGGLNSFENKLEISIKLNSFNGLKISTQWVELILSSFFVDILHL